MFFCSQYLCPSLVNTNRAAGMFNGKLWVEAFREIPVSQEMGGESLSLRHSRVAGISYGSGDSRAMGNSHILKAITFSSSAQIVLLKMHLKVYKTFFTNI